MTDIAVVGAGPAGVAAAITAAEAGAQVTLIDEYSQPGGQYFKQPAASLDANTFPPSLAATIRKGRELLAALSHPNIRLRCNTLVWNITPDRLLDLYGPEGPSRLPARKVIIASGAYERVVAFPGWTLPGVTTVGGAQLLLKGQGLLVGQRVLLAGTGPLLQLAGAQLLDAGADVVAIVELQSRREFLGNAVKLLGQWDKIGQGVANQRRLKEAGVPMRFGSAVVGALGEQQVEGAIIAQVDGNGRPRPRSQEELAVDAICLNFGFIPATELTRLAGCQQRFDAHFGSLATTTNDDLETSRAGIFAAGEVRGIGGAEVALLEGRIAGAAAARQLGYRRESATSEQEVRREWQKGRAEVASLATMFAVKPGLYDLATDDVMICRCEEVTAGAVREAARAGMADLNSLKVCTRLGMGRCQGRICGPIAAQIMARESGLALEAVGTFTARAPIKPIPLGALAIVPTQQSGKAAMEDHVGYGRAIIR